MLIANPVNRSVCFCPDTIGGVNRAAAIPDTLSNRPGRIRIRVIMSSLLNEQFL